MSVEVKICGLRDAAALTAAIDGGARYVGFVFCEDSRRAVMPEHAAELIAQVPTSITSVGLFVDPSDDELVRVLRHARLNMIQLHGSETPERVEAVKKFTGLPVMKALGIAVLPDIEAARRYESVADMLLFDAKPLPGGPKGGNGIAFDWGLLEGARFSKPWMLAGGLDAGNIAEAVALSGARILDVSSGVEDAEKRKSPSKIKAFLAKARGLETSY
ncbi:MAG: phosphoribosylanthranilate isomerase [Alphaproteobacteria bacterium]|nr:phosphoribosylanthranilate isomerase [Alphaproteobacteria bacterium]